MTSNERVDRRLEAGFELLAEPRFPDYLDDVLAVTRQRRQRPAWTFPGRWIPMVDVARQPVSAPALPWRAIALLLIAALAFTIVGSRPKLPLPIGPAGNGLFAFDSGHGISLTDPATVVTRLIPGTTASDHGPIWSPDGTTLAFVRLAAGVETLGFVRPDGSELRLIPNTDVISIQQAYNDPSEIGWSSDSRLLGYESETDSRLHVVNVATGTDRPVSPAGAVVDSISWRPGAPEVVAKVLLDNHWQLAILGLDGSARSLGPQAHHALELQAPTWSADGSRIAYQLENADGIRYEVHVANADGTNDRVVSGPTQSAWSTAWSPASNELVYFGQEPEGGYRLYTVGVDPGSAPITVSPTFFVGNFGWSPDGGS
jgi:Tol biopolymer transport system component